MSTRTTTSSSSSRGGPPQLLFDDGSRVMQEEAAAAMSVKFFSQQASPRGNIPLHEYYEVERISREILQQHCIRRRRRNNDDDIGSTNMVDDDTPQQEIQKTTTSSPPRIFRVALQFPDELLADSPEVSWLLSDQLQQDLQEYGRQDSSGGDNIVVVVPFVFVLGDTTVHSCCPDEVAALHLNADVLVHYGHACLSPTGTLPVLYSFGKLPIDDIDETVQKLEHARKAQPQHYSTEKILMLYQVGYSHVMPQLQATWQEMTSTDSCSIQMAQIPQPPSNNNTNTSSKRRPLATTACCQGGPSDDNNAASSCYQSSSTEQSGNNNEALQISCCQSASASCQQEDESGGDDRPTPDTYDTPVRRPLIVGGLELPADIKSWEDLSEYTIVFVMSSDPTKEEEDPSTIPPPHHRQYNNSMLALMSLPIPPKGYWIYTPTDHVLRTDATPSPSLQRQLKRRFFLTQKARDAHVFGILVSNLSQQHLVDVVQALQRILQDAGKASYSFAVGKINPAKLANFAEIDVFCLVACREQCLLDQEREYAVPVITPMELEIALGNLEWGAQPYSLDCQDVLSRSNNSSQSRRKDSEESDDDDAPYFSLVTGGYVSQNVAAAAHVDLDLQNLPGQGQVTEYKSEAANFLKQREYHGLESMVGQTEAKAAVTGLSGIASNYGGS
jgi:diphthamide biosynthesis protein 2